MKILAVDTCFGACSVAVLDGKKTLAHRIERMERGHAEALAPMVEALMHQAGLAFAALDRIGVTTGPGTFTGQRVGLAFMRGLRVALKKPLIGVTSLEAMCAQALDESGSALAAAIHDARRDEVYFAMQGGSPEPVFAAAFEDAVEDAVERETPFAAGGHGRQSASPMQCAGHRPVSPTAITAPDALWVAQLASAMPEPSEVPRPLYLRAPDAKLPAARP